jgi:HK97 family phage major capsid protein
MQSLQTPLRGIMFARAEANPAQVLGDLQRAFEAFKQANDERIQSLTKGLADVVQNEKVDRINADITGIKDHLDEIGRRMAANVVNGASATAELTPELRAARRSHASAFKNYFRRGEGEQMLRDLEVKAAMSVGSQPDGGYLAPVEMETTIDRVLATVSVMRNLATVRTIGAQAYRKPVNVGGTTSGWVGETETRAETNTPTISLLDFPAMEIYAEPRSTQQALDDIAMNIEQWLADEVAVEFAEEEGTAFISGNGVNRPRGVQGYTFVANASYAWGQIGYVASGAAGAFPASNPADTLLDLYGALRQGYRQNATFLMNRTVETAVRKFKDGNGQYLWTPGLQPGTPSNLLGYPIAIDDNMPDIAANTHSIMFGDFRRGYLIVDRVGIRVLRDAYTTKPFVKFYTTKRVGGGVQNFEAIKSLRFATS